MVLKKSTPPAIDLQETYPVGSILSHSSPITTARYSHLFDDPQRAAVERVAAIITGRPADKVVPIRGRRR